MTTSTTTVTLLAPRMRVEERLLIAAFAQRDIEASLCDTTTLALPMVDTPSPYGPLVLDRTLATADRATIGALLAANGTMVVNRTATTRLLADRLALMRHLIIARVPTPPTVVAFGEQAAIDGLRTIGFPAILQSVQVDPRMPDAVVTDQDAGEAAIEHRAMLGRETALLVQQYVLGDVSRLVVAGTEIVGIESILAEGSAVTYTPYQGDTAALIDLAAQVIARLGSGIYAIEVVESDAGPVVVGAGNLVDFRTLNEAGVDIVGKIAEFTCSQIREAQDGN